MRVWLQCMVHVYDPRYRNCEETDPVIMWFWEALDDMDTESKARLLQFVTGTSRVPVTGFRDLQGSLGTKKFCIELVASANPNSLPKAHTCFNRIDLPEYVSQAQMLEKLKIAMENTMGFGIE